MRSQASGKLTSKNSQKDMKSLPSTATLSGRGTETNPPEGSPAGGKTLSPDHPHWDNLTKLPAKPDTTHPPPPAANPPQPPTPPLEGQPLGKKGEPQSLKRANSNSTSNAKKKDKLQNAESSDDSKMNDSSDDSADSDPLAMNDDTPSVQNNEI